MLFGVLKTHYSYYLYLCTLNFGLKIEKCL